MKQFSIKAATTVAVLGGVLAGAITASAALNLPTQNCSYMFDTNMRLGSKGVDVMNLQKLLNGYPQTRVATVGAGSPGMETSTFGPATRAAANKFQALHLVELGITAPTGNVFAGTRGLLNMVCKSNGNPNPTPGPVVSGPVSVMLAPMQPTGMLVAGQAGARLAELTFTGNGTVTSLELQRVGVSIDSALTNVYLYDGNVRISDAASVVTGGYIRFNSPSGVFMVNGSRNITVRADIPTVAQVSTIVGQSVGVKLNSLTVMGGTPSTFTNVMGNSFQIGSAVPATASFSAMDQNPRTVDAGTTNYNVWSGTVSIGTRDVQLRSATYKFVGSAPVDAVANLSLYVDGSKVAGPAMINASNNNKVSFDLGASPFLLKTGSHTIDLRGDIVKGSFRTMTFSIENVADLMLEDSSLTGVNIASTVASAAMTQSTSAYGLITVNRGSVTVNVDPTFVANKVTGGATNVPVGQFTLKAYGEDVKVNTLKVTFATTTISTLNNASLYVNGGQVGTSQNFTVANAAAGGLTFTLGSSMIIPAGQTVSLTVKADIVDTNNAAYASGTVAAVIGGVASNAQGQNSNEIVTVASGAVTGNTLTISSGAGTFARTAGFTAVSVPPNTTNVKIGSFTFQASSAENVKISSLGVKPTLVTYAITNLSNLTIKDGSTVIGTPVGNPSTGTSTFSVSGDLIIPANGTKTFDVYADVGGAASGSVYVDMDATYRGVISNTTTVTSASGSAAAITSAAATLAASTLQSSQSPLSQFVVGGTTFGVATFTLKTAVAGTTAYVRELRFSTSGTDAAQTISVAGSLPAPVVSGTTTVTGLNILIGSTGTDVPVIVKYSQFQNNAKGEPGSLQAGVVSTTTLSYVEATSGSGSVITNGTLVAANPMTLVASKPTVTVSSGGTDALNIGALSKIGEFTVTADANGKIALASTSISISTVGINNPELATSTLLLKDGNTTVPNVSLVINASPTASTTPVFTFTTPYEIAAGTSKTFSIYGTINGSAATSIVPRSNVSLTSGATFKWNDVIGGNTTYTGALIYNFPSNSYTTKTN